MLAKILKFVLIYVDQLYFLFCESVRWNNSILLNSHIKVSKKSIVSVDDSYLKRSSIKVEESNQLIIKSTLVNSKISIKGKNNIVELLNYRDLNNLKLDVFGEDCHVIIENGTTINGAQIVCMGKKIEIRIGKECMLADHIEIWATDSHPIFTLDDPNNLINKSRSIIIGDHVWIAQNANILKGVNIGSGSIVGMSSVVTKNVPCNSIVVGNPAIITKSGVSWNRSFITI